VRCYFFQESVLDSQFPITAFEFPQPGAFGQFQRRLVTGVCGAVFLHPAADRRLVEPVFAGYLGDRPIRLDYELRNLVTKLGLVFRVFPRQFLSSFPDRTLFGPQSGKREARPPLGKIGHPRDGVHGRLQIVYGLLCSVTGIPIAIEVFEGNTADPKTLTAQITKLKDRFGLSRVAVVGDRGMLTSARIDDQLRPAALDWISALRAPQIKALVEDGALQLSLFDQQNLVEITRPDYPGERLVCCHNPGLAGKRARNRDDLLAATEKELNQIAAATRRDTRALRGKDKIALRVGKVINHYKVAKHFHIEITDDSFTFLRNTDRIAAEAALDGIYVLRTSLPNHTLPDTDVVARYKALADVERFFHTINGELDVRPSATGSPTGCARTCFCGCCPTTSAGT